jgi:hypothetical protein
MQRDFKVVSKGLKGKNETPFVILVSLEDEELILYLESPAQLTQFEIDQEFTVKIVEGAQQKLG